MQIKRLMQLHQKRLSESLEAARVASNHPGVKGSTSENEWIRLFREYLPTRYAVGTGFVIDCKDRLSEQIDVLIFDRYFTPILYSQEPLLYVPAESVYAGFEVKQSLNRATVEYASTKAKSIRQLHRAAVSIPTRHGHVATEASNPILTGLLTNTCDWVDGFDEAFTDAIRNTAGDPAGRLDLGCCVTVGSFSVDYSTTGIYINAARQELTLAYFYFSLLERLQSLGNACPIDYTEYLKAAHR